MRYLVMKSKEKNFVSAVVYVHNAGDRVQCFLQAIIDMLDKNFEHSEIICVNDKSTDNSLEKIKEISNRVNTVSISVINMSYFHGLEMSMNAGVDLSIGDFVFEFDNTCLDFEPDMIMKIYRRSLEGFDIVSASSDKRGKFSSSLFYKIFNRFSELDDKMNTESFRVLSRRVINRVSSMNKTIPYRKAVYANCGLKTDNIRYKTLNTKDNIDKTENGYRFRLAVDSLILFTEVGYKFSFMMTIVMMFISVFVVGYSVVIYLTSHPVAGWTTTVLFMSIAFFGLFAVLTIIIKYLQLLVDLTFKRKHYSFESIEKLTK